MNIHAKALWALCCASLIWGFNPLVSKLLLPYGTPLSFICIRFFFSSCTIFAFLAYKKRLRIPSIKNLIGLCTLGLLSVSLNNTIVLEGLRYSTITNCALINTLAPLLIALLAYVFLREHLLVIQWLGIILALVSTFYLLTGGDMAQLSQMNFNKGDVFFLCAQVSWAIYTLISCQILKTVPLLDMVAWSGLFGVGINLVYGSISGDLQIPILNTQSILCLAYMVWLGAMSAMLLWNYGVKNVGPTISAIFINLSTLIAIMSGVFFFNEPFTTMQLWGTLGVLLGIIFLTQHTFLARFVHKLRQ